MAGAVLLHRSMSPAGLREGVEEPIVSALLPWILTGWDT